MNRLVVYTCFHFIWYFKINDFFSVRCGYCLFYKKQKSILDFYSETSFLFCVINHFYVDNLRQSSHGFIGVRLDRICCFTYISVYAGCFFFRGCKTIILIRFVGQKCKNCLLDIHSVESLIDYQSSPNLCVNCFRQCFVT